MSAAPTPRLLPIDALNRATTAAFVEALRPLFEAAGPLGARLAAGRPYASYAGLLDAAAEAIEGLTPAEQEAVVNAHPRIGESAATVRQTSALSYREQGYDAEAGLPAEEVKRTYADLNRLNAAYEERFGFRFVVFVDRRPKSAIVEVLRARIRNNRDTELRTALGEMLAIARDRLHGLQPADASSEPQGSGGPCRQLA
ncbi:MAG: 2-oxo-4-hydroxy-4-carboxy-5-ureidoimidazoline decarboxylase [Chloroflexi bacterium]|nr:2-oxo-4-hydroxy-4-carboxy-5-ureidoimidazoline decarboxylase [Chloroflexota bacterium]